MNIEPFTRIFNIFVKNRWTEQKIYESVLENFCYLITNLEDPQRELIFELTERYNWISSNEYQGKLTNVLNSIEEEKLTTCKRIIVFPIMKPEDQEKVKSSHTILYMIRGLVPFLPKYNNIEIKEITKFEDISQERFDFKKTDLLFLVDDYLGSGDTIKSTLEIVLLNRSIETNRLNIVTVASQQDTIQFVKDIDIPLYYDHIEKKGISDYYDSIKTSEKKDLMLQIEKLIPGCSHFSLGFNQSEALITLMRTPDNTFPIFWKEYKKNGQKYKPPFPRY